jgi:hypothetical protein
MKRRMIHTKLIKLNGVREAIKLEIAELESMRKGINERQRAKLEMKIANRKQWIKDLDFSELEIREEL